VTRLALLSLFAAVLLLGGCCTAVPQKALDTAVTAAAGNDRYTELTTPALQGKTDLKKDGIAPVSEDDLKKTPASVRGLVRRLLEALHTNRHAWHSALFQIDKGPDPQKLNLKPVELPAIKKDPNKGLLGDK
jgi:hypothetical protein